MAAKAHEWQQAPPAWQWAARMDASGFPRLDLFKGMAAHLAQKRADEEDDPPLAILGRN